MPDWDANSPELQRNLREVLLKVQDRATKRKIPTIEDTREWQSLTMYGLIAANSHYIGAFCGEKGLENVEVKVLNNFGLPAKRVTQASKTSEHQLQAKVLAFDHALHPGMSPDAAMLQAIIELCAWAHAEWVRIHPLANGNGRTARFLANCLAMRYGLPAFVCLRPRPGENEYARTSEQAMRGNWKPTVQVFLILLNQALSRP
ncbi:MAG TPA: Fic family protein [Candidatus Methylacidiphilales bacterium]|nr:Fic family protein [Candidatus Methylacidiphilales bacterium]